MLSAMSAEWCPRSRGLLSAITAECCPPSTWNGVRDHAEYALRISLLPGMSWRICGRMEDIVEITMDIRMYEAWIIAT